MAYSIEPSYVLADGVCKELVNASKLYENRWYFSEEGFNASRIDRTGDFSVSENFAVVSDKKIIAYIEARWLKNLKVLVDFKIILFDLKKKLSFVDSVLSYFEYVFVSRGCDVITFDVPEKNTFLARLCQNFTSKYFGHKCGMKTRNIKSINGEISDAILYEITKEEYSCWKNSIN
ncbi:hypothetical protein II906_07890 [bacterium]|nr:hypothetical protein [bacterium]